MKSDYRAWHKEMKSMHEVGYINWDKEEAGIHVGCILVTVPFKDIILMRNTHEQDISGTDVYEGDFIKSHHWGDKVLMLVKYGTFAHYCPDDNSVGFFVEADGFPQMSVGPLSDYAKVIGNVYENVEWLDK